MIFSRKGPSDTNILQKTSNPSSNKRIFPKRQGRPNQVSTNRLFTDEVLRTDLSQFRGRPFFEVLRTYHRYQSSVVGFFRILWTAFQKVHGLLFGTDGLIRILLLELHGRPIQSFTGLPEIRRGLFGVPWTGLIQFWAYGTWSSKARLIKVPWTDFFWNPRTGLSEFDSRPYCRSSTDCSIVNISAYYWLI